MTKIPRTLIYTDASTIKGQGTGIGIYSPSTNTAETFFFSDCLKPHEAEALGIKIALELANRYFKNQKVTILNDCQPAVLSLEIQNVSWIPREANQIADKLARVAINKRLTTYKKEISFVSPSKTPITSLGAYIRDNYPLPTKVKLLLKLAKTDYDRILARSLLNKQQLKTNQTINLSPTFKKACATILTRLDKTPSIRAVLGGDMVTLGDIAFTKLLRKLT